MSYVGDILPVEANLGKICSKASGELNVRMVQLLALDKFLGRPSISSWRAKCHLSCSAVCVCVFFSFFVYGAWCFVSFMTNMGDVQFW